MLETLRVDDLTVLCERPAHATHRPVLFVPGYLADATIFRDWLTFFASRGFPSYALNLRGRAGSRPGTSLGRAAIADFVDDASVVARTLDKPIVVGHSMGGLIAQCLAERGLVHAAALVTPAPPRGIPVLTPKLAITQFKYLPRIFASKVIEPSRGDLKALVLNCVPREEQDRIVDLFVPDSGRAGRDMSITGVPVDARRVKCPLLILSASEDRFIPPRVVERIAKRYRAPVQMMKGHAHALIIEPGWQVIADTVARWAASV